MGYAVIPRLLSDHNIADVIRELCDLDGGQAGMRNLLDLHWCASLAGRICDDAHLGPILGQRAVAIDCTLFVKSVDRNWLVAIHQDLSIPMAARREDPEWTGWSRKQGRLFAQPPVRVLEELIAVRIHLDDCDEGNGALRVVPGSHKYGRLNPRDVLRNRDRHGEQTIPVNRAGAMIMKPLLLHASSKSSSFAPRRVLQFVLAPLMLAHSLRMPIPEAS